MSKSKKKVNLNASNTPNSPDTSDTSSSDSVRTVIQSVNAFQQMLAEIKTNRPKLLGLDTEFIRESSFFPKLELLQIATQTATWVIDAQWILKEYREGIEDLKKILTAPEILKVIHAAAGDQEVLFAAFELIAAPVFDTAVGASLLGLGDSIGLSALTKEVLNIELKKGHSRTNWSVRPLQQQLIDYAHYDVEHLVELANELLLRLAKLNREKWAFDICKNFESVDAFLQSPEALTLKIAGHGKLDKKTVAALLELVRWRESRVRELDLPRKWVADDQVLLDLAKVRPKDIAHLSAFRGLNKGELKASGAKIFSALESAKLKLEKGELEQVVLDCSQKAASSYKNEIPSADEKNCIELLKCYLGILATQNQIASKHLLTVGQMLPLLRQRKNSLKAWIENNLISEHSASLVGQDLQNFLNGQISLCLSGQPVHVAISTKS